MSRACCIGHYMSGLFQISTGEFRDIFADATVYSGSLKRDIPVIPVQVQGATAPRPEQLPDALKDLAYRNAMELTHPRWESDVQLLVNAVRPYVSRPHAGPEPEVIQPGKKSTRFKYFSVGVVVLFVLGVVSYLWPGDKVVGPPAQK